jgi:tetratricopeptide (TPR) repeat protein
MPSPDELLLAGETYKAIDVLQRDYARDNDDATLNSLGMAYLYAGQFRRALRAFQKLIADKPRHAADEYSVCGIILWILNRRAEGVDIWKEGERCGYGDAAGNIGVPLLLYYAAVTAPDLYSLESALALLEKRLARSISYHWPGGIARLLVGRIDREEADEHKSYEKWTHPHETAELEFYDGIRHRRLGDEAACRQHLQACVDCGNVGMYAPVWFLAKYELGLIKPPKDARRSSSGKRRTRARKSTKRSTTKSKRGTP